MLKSLIIIGHLIGIFFLSFLFSDEITIIDTFPESLEVGENYTVTATITKNDVTGFAKYQIEAPKGIMIKPINLSGASFTFKDGKAKFIWMNLPTEPSFDIVYELTLETGELGSKKEVNSRFSYLVENERKIHEGPNHVLNVSGGGEVATNNTSSGSSDISASRKITAEGDNKFLVEIDINKLGVKGFAKIQDAIPNGFIATEVMNSEAIFTQTESKVKLVWFDIPKNMSLNVSYLLEAPADFTGNATIEGKFHYMSGSDLNKIEVPSQVITIGAEAVADNNSAGTNSTEVNTTTSSNESVSDVENVVDETASNSTNTSTLDENINSNVNETTNKIDESITESVNETENKIIETTSNDVENSVNQKTDEMVSNNETVENTANKVDEMTNSSNDNLNNETASDNSSTESSNETTSFLDTFVTDQSSKSDGGTDDKVNSISNDTANNDVSDSGSKNESGSKSTSSTNIETDDKSVSNVDSNDNVATINSQNNSGSTSNTSNNAATNDNSGNNMTPTKTDDMTANIAQPESTAVATAEYVKDEVIAEERNFSNLTNVTAADKGINYRVQIMAGKNVVGKEYLRKKHSFYSDFVIENHEGWIKYTSGSYESYKIARDQRNIVREQYNFNGPFVSAYNDGVRITVQEALMITKQQWYN